MRIYLLLTAACALALSGPASARDKEAAKVPPAMQRLLACRAVTDAAQRLACFDRESAGVEQAVAVHDLVVVDRENTRAARRSLFGFSVPNFGGLFGSEDDAIKQIESTITATRRNPEGGWTVRLADHSEWTQTDDTPIISDPKRGDKVVIRAGILGSFRLSVNGQPGVKVKRVA